jgi:hypothetical protein
MPYALNESRFSFFLFMCSSFRKKNFLVNANPQTAALGYRRVFGHNYLVYHWSGLQALAPIFLRNFQLLRRQI